MGHLREAVDRFAALGWDGLAALARARYLALQGTGTDGASLAILGEVGIADPQRWATVALPALEPVTP